MYRIYVTSLHCHVQLQHRQYKLPHKETLTLYHVYRINVFESMITNVNNNKNSREASTELNESSVIIIFQFLIISRGLASF